MSIIAQKVTPVLNPQNGNAGHGGKEEKRKRVRPYKARLATNVKHALEDSMQRSKAARKRMRNALEIFDQIRSMFEKHDRLSGKDYDLVVRVFTAIGSLEHELYGLSLEVADNEEIVAQAIAEARPATKKAS